MYAVLELNASSFGEPTEEDIVNFILVRPDLVHDINQDAVLRVLNGHRNVVLRVLGNNRERQLPS